MPGMWLSQPVHLALGTGYSSPCGLFGMQHRALRYARGTTNVTCRRCLSWIRKNPELFAKDVTP